MKWNKMDLKPYWKIIVSNAAFFSKPASRGAALSCYFYMARVLLNGTG